MLTQTQREIMANAVISAMSAHYTEQCESGDFVDALRYLSHDASDDELQQEQDKWCKKVDKA